MRRIPFALAAPAAVTAALAFLPIGNDASAESRGLPSPSANAADTGGDNNGCELDASNIDGADDRHRYYNYRMRVPGGSGAMILVAGVPDGETSQRDRPNRIGG